jgi:hypothetical protein
VRPGTGAGPPLLVCNGIGASLDLLQPFRRRGRPSDRSGPVRRTGGGPGPGTRGCPTSSHCWPGSSALVHGLGCDRFDALGISRGAGLLAARLPAPAPLPAAGAGRHRNRHAHSARTPQRAEQDAHTHTAALPRPGTTKAIAPELWADAPGDRRAEAHGVRAGPPSDPHRLLPPVPRRFRLDETDGLCSRFCPGLLTVADDLVSRS